MIFFSNQTPACTESWEETCCCAKWWSSLEHLSILMHNSTICIRFYSCSKKIPRQGWLTWPYPATPPASITYTPRKTAMRPCTWRRLNSLNNLKISWCRAPGANSPNGWKGIGKGCTSETMANFLSEMKRTSWPIVGIVSLRCPMPKKTLTALKANVIYCSYPPTAAPRPIVVPCSKGETLMYWSSS